MAAPNIDVSSAVDHQKLRLFHIGVVLIMALVAVTEGFDLQVAALAAPGIAHEWGISRAELTPILTAGFVGILFGAPLMGWLGDRFGRKPAILIGCLIFGLSSAASAYAPDVTSLTALRVITGVGLGGVLPNVFALTAELSPAKERGVFTGILGLGLILGSASVAILSGAVGGDDWRRLFLVGGAAGVIAAGLAAILPESPTLLAMRGKTERLAKVMRVVAPAAPAGATFVVTAGPAQEGKPNLFAGGLRLVTPMVWLMYVCASVILFFITTWMPAVLHAEGIPPERAAFIVSLFHVGGIGGAILASFAMRTYRFGVLVGMWVLAIIAVLSVAFAHLGEDALAVAVACCGFAVLGAQTALNANASLVYPTALRAGGMGAAYGVSRFGSIGGALLGGALASLGALSAQQLFLVPALPLAIALAAATYVTLWQKRQGASA
jgi:AAHS family 4-hydroxybenzoate transporter-like MFS transporter